MTVRLFASFLILILCTKVGVAQGSGPIPQNSNRYIPSTENIENREWFRDASFGMFIHWGIYSMLGDGEWVLTNKNMNEKEYRTLAAGFYPSEFNADEWVRIAKDAGMKYICFTSRHHDGFSMFDTKQSDYNIVKATPFKRDVVKELAEACKREGLRLFLYYSHIDWHRSDYFPLGRTGRNLGREPQGSWTDYRAFMDAQLTELLTQYGPIGGIWFDGWWDKPNEDWGLKEQYALIHRLQSGCLIGNNHHVAPMEGEDFQMFERDLPGQNTAGYSADASIGNLPLETCETMNKTWGYNIADRDFKSTKALIHRLVGAAGRNANLLLNVGPRPNGTIPDESVLHLKEIGEWMNIYGETIHGTRGGSIPPQEWGVTTQKGDKLYIHILSLEADTIELPLQPKQVKGISLFKDKIPLKYKKSSGGIVVELGSVSTDIDTVVEIKL